MSLLLLTSRTGLAVHYADGLGIVDFLDPGHGGDTASRGLSLCCRACFELMQIGAVSREAILRIRLWTVLTGRLFR